MENSSNPTPPVQEAKIKSSREILREKRLARQKRQQLTLILIFAAIVVIVLGLIFIPKLSEHNPRAGFTLGDPNAPVYVQEFANFRCSHCRNYALTMEDAIIENYVNTGYVYYEFVNFPFGTADTYDAAEATYCAAEQNGFWAYKHTLFEMGISSNTNAFTQTNLLAYAEDLDMDRTAFEECLESDRYLAEMDKDYKYAISSGITGTPSFIVNGQTVYADGLEAAIQDELAKLNN